ncbi:hypothetical protein CSX00_01270 [Pseudobutyrivibrio ruminis]|uniref:WG containing repeat-containing protein n=1 Tax=Pseudobutyrivibrio ruminis TaxID=46206 RepID=A0A2G3EE19_9FIRM|nr:hypothetical protein CSX00_01270 [Pseudobutyrivibrio ruminis]
MDLKLSVKTKLSKINISFVIFVLTLWNFFNVASHIFSFYHPFITDKVDYLFYGFEIVLLTVLSLISRYNPNKRIHIISSLINSIIFFNVVELYISIFAYNTATQFITIIFMISFVYRVFVNVCIYIFFFDEATYQDEIFHISKEAITPKSLKVYCIYFVIIFAILLISVHFNKDFFVFTYPLCILFVAFLLFCCFALRGFFNNIGPTNDKYYFKGVFGPIDFFDSNIFKNSVRVIKYSFLLCIAVLGVVVLKKRNTYETLDIKSMTKEQITSSKRETILDFLFEGNGYYRYGIKNEMPDWSGFNHNKYGLVNVETGEYTEAIYNGPLFFDRDGISPDHEGHFINYEGEIVFDIPTSIYRKKSSRQKLIDNNLASILGKRILFNEYSVRRDDSYYSNKYEESVFFLSLDTELNDCFVVAPIFSADWENIPDRAYFDEGIAIYFSEMDNGYGFISENGTILTDPIYTRVETNNNGYKAIPVSNEEDGLDVLTSDMKSLLPDNNRFSLEDINYNLGLLCYSVYNQDILDEEIYIEDFNGKIWDGYYKYPEGNSEPRLLLNDYNSLIKCKDGKESAVIMHGGKILFESEKYKAAYITLDADEKPLFVRALDFSDHFHIVDFDGKEIIPGTYFECRIGSDAVLYLESADEGHEGEAVLADIYGNIKYTGFKFEKYYEGDHKKEEPSNLKVSRTTENGITLYNYINNQGELLGDWFIFTGTENLGNSVTLNYIATCDDEGIPTVHWYRNDVEIMSGHFYGDIDENSNESYFFGVCDAYGGYSRYFWFRNQEGEYDIYHYDNITGEANFRCSVVDYSEYIQEH